VDESKPAPPSQTPQQPTVGTTEIAKSSDSEPTTQSLATQSNEGAPHDDAPTGTSRPTGPAVIAAYLKNLPGVPGVYRMIDLEGNVIYVGKARSLKARVSNYARLGGHTNRIARMIAATAAMEFVTVRTEAEALLLEANLIKRFRPRFNVLLRDDKSFPLIFISRGDDGPSSIAPQISKHRGARTRKGDYFGPFASAGAVNRTINMLQRAFLLRSCTDSVFTSRTRPCLLYQIKRCSGPCTGEISPHDYGHLVDEATRFLRGESQSVRRMYQQLMESASADLEFERAALYRNRLWALAHIQADQAINTDGVEEADVFAAYQEGGQTCVQVFFFRAGQNWGNRAYFPKADRSIETADVLESFIAQFYDDKPVPPLILVSHNFETRELMAEALATKSEQRADGTRHRRVEIRVPQRGAKSGLVDHALQNAREALGRKLAESSSQRTLLAGLANRFGLDEPPRRIEVFDNSHISGTNAVGGMIVAGPEGLVKSAYRKFTIKSEIAPGDDYAMMREVLTRRFKRLAESGPMADTKTSPALDADPPPPSGLDAAPSYDDVDTMSPLDDAPFPDWPDVVLIDGGPGQLKVAQEVFADLGISGPTLIGIAKGPDRDAGREHFHMAGRDLFMLEPRDPVLYFIQRLRDEAHRFAIGTHREKRRKQVGVNPLDEIDGIGPKRKRALMSHFGSAKAVSRAGVDDLKTVDGISAETAQKIYDFFHDPKT